MSDWISIYPITILDISALVSANFPLKFATSSVVSDCKIHNSSRFFLYSEGTAGLCAPWI